jgi:hypothetical protein
MVVANQLPEIEVSPASLSGELLQGETMTRTLTISNNGEAALAYQLTREPGADWIQMEPTEGTVSPGGTHEIEVTLDATSSEPGEQSGWIRVSSNDPAQPQVDVPVTMDVLAAEPEIGVAPDALAETVVEGASVVRTLTISNTGIGDLTFHMGTEETASAQVLDAYWIVLEPTSGTVSAGGEQAIQVTLDAAGLPPDTYNAVIHVYSNDPLTPTLNVPVTLTVTEAPTQFTIYLPIVLR